MWFHIIIFAFSIFVLYGWKNGWFPQGMNNKKGIRLFMMIVLIGNFTGMFLTLTKGGEEHYKNEVKLEKTTEGAYEEQMIMSTEKGERTSVSLQIPEKETQQEEEAADETEQPQEVQRKQEIINAVAQYNLEKNDPDYFYLPEELEGEKVTWEKPGDSSGELLAGIGLITAFMIMIFQSREEQEKLLKRREQLLLDYPGLVMKFTLLIQAGMTTRKAFEKIALDYRRKKPRSPRIAYEEVVTACYEMKSGISEYEAYQRFGERCDQVKYKTFSTLLIQNLQKGSRYLSEMLERESMEAWDERKRKARILGEAAATKLLLPMVMILLVVMAIIMIPAMLSFYG